MLNKILKYDLKRMGKSLLPLYAGLIILALVLKTMDFITNNFSAFKFAYNIMFIFFIIAIIGGLFYTFSISIIHYYKNLYSDEGYLTHTLPVSKSNLLISKILSSIMYIIVSVIISLISLIIVLGYNEITNPIKNILEFFSTCADTKISTISIILTLIILLGYIFYILMVFAGISLGNNHNKNKITFSIIYTVVLYYISQIISVLALGIMILINPDITSQLDQAIPDKQYLYEIISLSIGLNIILILAYYLICYNRLKNLNLS